MGLKYSANVFVKFSEMSIAGKLGHHCGLLDRSVVFAIMEERLFAATLIPKPGRLPFPALGRTGSVHQSPGAQSSERKKPNEKVSGFSLEGCARPGPARWGHFR